MSNRLNRTDTSIETIDEVKEERDAVLELRNVSKLFGDLTAVKDVSLSVYEGELLTLLGPSGCGKTTVLRVIAGLERPDEGAVYINGREAAGNRFIEPEDREVGIVFQDFALFPHMTVEENIAFGLKDLPEEERENRVKAMLNLVGLSEYRDASPSQLSGGQKQRVALARSLAPEPEIILLDEPFSNLDVSLRVEMREEVRRILKEAGVTAVSVTHDQEEAFSISDRIAVMNAGRIEQVGLPERVFQQPESRFVAGFLGQASFLSGEVSDERVETTLGDVDLDLIEGLTQEYDGATVDLLLRPDDIVATPAEPEEANGKIVYRQYNGPTFVYRVELENGDIVHCLHNHVERYSLGDTVNVEIVADHPLAWYPPEE
ncbi:MAG: ABC transporter ATP-binding protein [Halobacteria archaeon]|nr:ABC transporter ATP-binding protein [Halobacteria archaeon]